MSASLSRHAEPVDDRRRLVRHGHQPERDVMTGIGTVPVIQDGFRENADSRRDLLRDRGTGALWPPNRPGNLMPPGDGSDRERPCRSTEPDPQDPGAARAAGQPSSWPRAHDGRQGEPAVPRGPGTALRSSRGLNWGLYT